MAQPTITKTIQTVRREWRQSGSFSYRELRKLLQSVIYEAEAEGLQALSSIERHAKQEREVGYQAGYAEGLASFAANIEIVEDFRLRVIQDAVKFFSWLSEKVVAEYLSRESIAEANIFEERLLSLLEEHYSPGMRLFVSESDLHSVKALLGSPTNEIFTDVEDDIAYNFTNSETAGHEHAQKKSRARFTSTLPVEVGLNLAQGTAILTSTFGDIYLNSKEQLAELWKLLGNSELVEHSLSRYVSLGDS